MFQISQYYSGITTTYITEFCKNCPTCQLSQPKKEQPPLKPIIAQDFMERIQIDLIDMIHSPDGDFNYIGHFEDHMTKFHILFPLRDKSANEVATTIEERVLASVGPPHIFHSDNGREFVNQLLHSLLETWSSGNVTFVNGRPRHSQSQGLVERGNRTVQEKIAAIKNDEGFTGKMSFPWVSWLPRIMYSINTQVHTTTKEMPYKLVFGQYPRSQLIPGAEQHIVNEEDITEITQPSSVPVSSDSSPATSTQSSSSVPVTLESSPATSTQSSPKAQNWIIQKETVLKWTPSSLSSCSSSRSRLPSLPSTSPEVKLTAQ